MSTRAPTVVLVFVLVAAGCLGASSGDGETTVRVREVNETALARDTTRGIGDGVRRDGNLAAVLRNGSVTAAPGPGDRGHVYRYRGRFYRVERERVGTDVTHVVHVDIEGRVRQEGPPSGTPFESFPAVDRRKLRDAFAEIAQKRREQGPRRTVYVGTTLEYSPAERNESVLSEVVSFRVVYEEATYTLSVRRAKTHRTPVYRYERVPAFESTEAYADWYVPNHTAEVEFSPAERTAFERVRRANGSLSTDDEAARRVVDAVNESDEFRYTARTTRTWLVRYDGRVYAVDVTDPSFDDVF